MGGLTTNLCIKNMGGFDYLVAIANKIIPMYEAWENMNF